MAFEFLSNLDTTAGFLILIIFILFIFSFKKVLGLIKNALIILAASVLFPIVGNKFFGLAVPTDGETIFSFALIGLGAYFLYILASAVYKGISYLERGAKRVPKVSMEKPKETVPSAIVQERAITTKKPYVVGSRKRKSWEKDYVKMEDIDAGTIEKKIKVKKRRTKNAKMEKIRVTGEDAE